MFKIYEDMIDTLEANVATLKETVRFQQALIDTQETRADLQRENIEIKTKIIVNLRKLVWEKNDEIFELKAKEEKT